MKSTVRILLIGMLIAAGFYFTSCSTGSEDGADKDPQPADPCENGPSNVEISDFLHSFEGKNTGEIEIQASGGNGNLKYSIDGENFKGDNVFTGLAAGAYTITVIDDSSCTATLNYEVLEFPEVSFANDVKKIINGNCQISPCHGSNPSIPSWDSYANISARADRIRAMVTQKFMPPPSSGGSLSEEQIATIRDWVDVGAPNN